MLNSNLIIFIFVCRNVFMHLTLLHLLHTSTFYRQKSEIVQVMYKWVELRYLLKPIQKKHSNSQCPKIVVSGPIPNIFVYNHNFIYNLIFILLTNFLISLKKIQEIESSNPQSKLISVNDVFAQAHSVCLHINLFQLYDNL